MSIVSLAHLNSTRCRAGGWQRQRPQQSRAGRRRGGRAGRGPAERAAPVLHRHRTRRGARLGQRHCCAADPARGADTRSQLSCCVTVGCSVMSQLTHVRPLCSGEACVMVQPVRLFGFSAGDMSASRSVLADCRRGVAKAMLWLSLQPSDGLETEAAAEQDADTAQAALAALGKLLTQHRKLTDLLVDDGSAGSDPVSDVPGHPPASDVACHLRSTCHRHPPSKRPCDVHRHERQTVSSPCATGARLPGLCQTCSHHRAGAEAMVLELLLHPTSEPLRRAARQLLERVADSSGCVSENIKQANCAGAWVVATLNIECVPRHYKLTQPPASVHLATSHQTGVVGRWTVRVLASALLLVGA